MLASTAKSVRAVTAFLESGTGVAGSAPAAATERRFSGE